MKPFAALVFALPFFLFAFLTTSCVTNDADYSHLERDPVALGERTGRADAFAGRDDDYTRHLHELHPDADEEDFEDAYDDAYDDAEDEMDELEEQREASRETSSRRAYDSGYDQGELDRYRGLSRNPRRHDAASAGSSSANRAWIDGYEEGWNDR